MKERVELKSESETLEKWESQMRKGMLDFIILLCLDKRESYGYELIRTIKETAELDLSEGTIYPLLNRLRGEGLIASRWQEMESGIPRKYYRICEKGMKTLARMTEGWARFHSSLRRLMENEK